uniref:PEHE domain-containing protein n=1 Tax=Syphacia muris TaxID=451379 RepID=A0A0N5A839_9BILA
MGKPLRKPMPTFSSIGNENRICTRNSTQLKNSRVPLTLPSSSKNLRSGEQLGRKPTSGLKCATSPLRAQGITRSSSKNGIINDEEDSLYVGTSASSIVKTTAADENPPSKRLKLRDSTHVLKHVNKSNQPNTSSKSQIYKSVAYPFHQYRCNSNSEQETSIKKQLKCDDQISTFLSSDQNVFPSTSSASDNVASADGNERLEPCHIANFQRCRSSFMKKVSPTTSKYSTRGLHITERILPPPIHLEVAPNGFQLPARRKSARIQEKKWKEVSVADSYEDVKCSSDIRGQDEQIEIPKFSFVGDIEASTAMDRPTTEDLADETFLKRHEKKETEERRARKNDLREQREQAFRERMLRKQMKYHEPSPPPAPKFTLIQVVGNENSR